MLLEQDGAVERRGVLQGVRAQSEHLFSLICDLMTLSGLNTGRIAVEIRPVNIADLFGRVRQLTHRLGRDRDIAVTWSEDPELREMMTDGRRVEQILTNLVTNAFKFTAHGTISISVYHDRIRDHVVFSVADTGSGIPRMRCRTSSMSSARSTDRRVAVTAASGSGWPWCIGWRRC